MFTDKQLERYADVLIWALRTARTGRLQKNDVVAIRYHQPAIGLAEILFSKLLQMGIHPVPRSLPTPVMEKHFFEIANQRQLTFTPPGDKKLHQNLNGSIFLYAPESITHLSAVDPGKIGKAAVAQKHLRDILNRRDERGAFSWTLCMFPTRALARHARLSMKEYTRQIVNACFLNRREPVAEWQHIYKKINAIKKWLNCLKVTHFHIESDTIDLEVAPGEKRKWLGLSGHNIPSFEVFLSPDWRSTRGTYYADQPSYRSGNYVRGVRLEFARGSVSRVQAQKGENFIKQQLKMDAGAGRIGEFSLTDKRFSRISTFMANTLFDENHGGRYGNCHVALGSSYTDSYSGKTAALTSEMKKKLGFNDSALHWDLVNTEKKRVTAHLESGRKVVIYENGRFAR